MLTVAFWYISSCNTHCLATDPYTSNSPKPSQVKLKHCIDDIVLLVHAHVISSLKTSPQIDKSQQLPSASSRVRA